MVRDYSGGMTTDWGAHHFDIAQWGMGRDESGPILVEAPETSEFGTLTYTYDDGVKLIRSNRTAEGTSVNGVLFTGTDGKIEVNRGHFRAWPQEIADEPLASGDVHLPRSTGHVSNWIDAIRTRRRPLCDVAIGASSVTVCHLGNIASWSKRSLRWDPEGQQILNDETAARWLDRPRRAPWQESV